MSKPRFRAGQTVWYAHYPCLSGLADAWISEDEISRVYCGKRCNTAYEFECGGCEIERFTGETAEEVIAAVEKAARSDIERARLTLERKLKEMREAASSGDIHGFYMRKYREESV